MPLHRLLHDTRLRPLWRGLLLALMLVVCWLAFTPKPPALPFGNADKLHHIGAFIVLAACALLGGGPGRRAAGGAALAMGGFGVFIELVQTQTPGRTGDAPDLVADAIGIAIGVALVLAARRRFPAAAPKA